MKSDLTKTECLILGVCKVFYDKQYGQLPHKAIHCLLYLLSRKESRVIKYCWTWTQDGPYADELEIILEKLDLKQDAMMDFYEFDMMLHTVSAKYLSIVECLREMLYQTSHPDMVVWTEHLAAMSLLVAQENSACTETVLCNRYIMMKYNSDYTLVKDVYRTLDRAKLLFVE